MSEQFNFGPAKSQMADATTTASGLMSATDKSKLDGIESQANKTVVSDSLVDTSTTNALSAAQGKALNDSIATLNSNIVKSLADGSDLNAITEPGYYNFTIAGTLVNAPATGTNRLGLIVQRSESNLFVTQLAFENLQNNFGVYFRRCLGGSWSAWEKFALASNISNLETNKITRLLTGDNSTKIRNMQIGWNNDLKWFLAVVDENGVQRNIKFDA